MIHDLEENKLLREVPVLEYGDSCLHKITHLADDHLDFDILLTYINKTGEHGETEFRLQRAGPNSVGFNVEEK